MERIFVVRLSAAGSVFDIRRSRAEKKICEADHFTMILRCPVNHLICAKRFVGIKMRQNAMTIFWCCEIKSVYAGNLDNALFCRISMVVDVAGAVVRQRLHPLVEARSKEKTTKIFKSWVERILFGLICSPSPLDSDNMKLNYLHKWLLLLRSLYPHECSTKKKCDASSCQ